MNTAQALHNAARRFCIEQHKRWCDVYSKMADRPLGVDYSPEALDTFPRYNMLNAILHAVETIDPETLDDFATAKALITQAGFAADDAFTREPSSKIVADAQDSEREKFCKFVDSLSELDVWNYEELPYRRVLSQAESDSIWSALRKRWGVARESEWYPSFADVPRSEIADFRTDAFGDVMPTRSLRKWLRDQGVERVWELREYGPEFELDIDALDPIYNGAEGFWTSTNLEWLLYASHESTMTAAGSLLVEIKKNSDWEGFKIG